MRTMNQVAKELLLAEQEMDAFWVADATVGFATAQQRETFLRDHDRLAQKVVDLRQELSDMEKGL